jgi:hypothetical protein
VGALIRAHAAKKRVRVVSCGIARSRSCDPQETTLTRFFAGAWDERASRRNASRAWLRTREFDSGERASLRGCECRPPIFGRSASTSRSSREKP